MPEYDPTIENNYRKQLDVDGRFVILEILDTAGQDEFRGLIDQHLVAGDGFVLVFSVTERKSLNLLSEFHSAILQTKDKESFPMILVGNKIDLPREITKADGEAVADKWNIPYIETSAKKNENIADIFLRLIRDIRKNDPQEPKKANRRRGCNLL
jgi:small GTP-binding protein